MISFRKFLIEAETQGLGDAAKGIPLSANTDASKLSVPPEVELVEQRFAAARFFLQKHFPLFYAMLAKMSVIYTYDVDTMAVDDKGNIYINPVFGSKSLTYNQFVGVIIHEVFHVANLTFARKKDRDHRLWNICTDVIMNRDIQDNLQEYMKKHKPGELEPQLPLEAEMELTGPDGKKVKETGKFYTPVKDGDKWVIDITLGNPKLREAFNKAKIDPNVDVTEMSAEQLYHYCEMVWKKVLPPPPPGKPSSPPGNPPPPSHKPWAPGDRVKGKVDGKKGTVISATPPDANGDQQLDIEWDDETKKFVANKQFSLKEAVSTGLSGKDFKRLVPPGGSGGGSGSKPHPKDPEQETEEDKEEQEKKEQEKKNAPGEKEKDGEENQESGGEEDNKTDKEGEDKTPGKGSGEVEIEEEEESQDKPGNKPGKPGAEKEIDKNAPVNRGAERQTSGKGGGKGGTSLEDILNELPKAVDHINDPNAIPSIKRLPGSDRQQSWSPEEAKQKAQDAANTGDRRVKEIEQSKAQQDTVNKVKDLFKPKVDWKKVLTQTIVGPGKVRYTFQKPAKRYMGHGIYMPSKKPEPSTKFAAIAIDSSGSITPQDIARFINEVHSAIVKYKASIFLILYHDYVYFSKEYNYKNAGDLYKLTFSSGGNNDNCIWPYIVKHKLDSKIKSLVVLTDGYFFEQFKPLPPQVDLVFILVDGGTTRYMKLVDPTVVFLNRKDEKQTKK